jgi:hypothetical protein
MSLYVGFNSVPLCPGLCIQAFTIVFGVLARSRLPYAWFSP